MYQQKPNFTPIDVTNIRRSQNKFIAFIRKKPPKKRLAIVAAVSIGLLIIGVAALQLFGPKDPKPVAPIVLTRVEKPPEPVITYSALTGVETTPEVAAKPVVGVMIENSIDARPQSGLEEAGIVFEAIAEGGITRFLALYQEANPANIGPIRSARPYYVQWARGYDAAYVHSGGSGEALALIRSLGVKDLDHGAFGEKVASRVNSRYAPHNVYTSLERIRNLATAQSYTAASTFTPFTRVVTVKDEKKKKAKDEAAESTAIVAPTPATSIQFNISGANYNTSYTYIAETKEYGRTLAGKPHTDQESGKQITPEVVIALITTYGIHPDGVHSQYGNIGNGEALVFQNGTVSAAKWKKESAGASLEITDPSGAPLPLNPGQTWITAIPAGRITHTP